MTARVTLIPAKCPPASCATCHRQIAMLHGKRTAVQVDFYAPDGRWLERKLHHESCYQGQHGEPERRPA
jgi:hypothetical protein